MEEPPSCETRYLFLAGHVLLIIGFTCYVVGFATVGWVDAGGVRQGLWSSCEDHVHRIQQLGQRVAGRISNFVDLWPLSATFWRSSWDCCSTACPTRAAGLPPASSPRGSWKYWPALDPFSASSGCASWAETVSAKAPCSSSSLTAASLILIVPGTFMTGFTRRGVTRSIKNRNSIVPQTPAPSLSQTPARGRLPPLPGASSGIGVRAGVDSSGPQGLHVEPQGRHPLNCLTLPHTIIHYQRGSFIPWSTFPIPKILFPFLQRPLQKTDLLATQKPLTLVTCRLLTKHVLLLS
ncbi:uncharacterized protein LOC112569233 [Pomacea canaliculata]|uniref:uncharacterized protein LOC112569233 n=1 Tax=Pomacea canaliculata TaxID=400727 RepID=UPI000D73D12B|nr:uncharacterized protein LOC112569233 [Pomacea canaliculata]